VSVVIPTFNRVELLSETIDSALAQDVDLEIVVCDNASTDATAQMVQQRGDSRISLITSPENIGPQRNTQLAWASGTAPLVAMLHDDDVMRPGNLAAKLAFLNEHPDVGMVYSAYGTIDEHGDRLADSYRAPGPVDAIEPGSLFIDRCLAGVERAHMSTSVVRRSAMAGLSPLVADGTHIDFGFFLRLALRCPIGFLEAPLVDIRIHRATWSFQTGVVEGSATGPLVGGTIAGFDARANTVKRFADELSEPQRSTIMRAATTHQKAQALMAAKVALRGRRVGESLSYVRRAFPKR
jgi:glycosyltransferase involved in cell wall biosynthesis